MKSAHLLYLTIFSFCAICASSLRAESTEPKGISFDCATDADRAFEGAQLNFRIQVEGIVTFDLGSPDNVYGLDELIHQDGKLQTQTTNKVLANSIVNFTVTPDGNPPNETETRVMDGFYKVGEITDNETGKRVSKVSRLVLLQETPSGSLIELNIKPQLGDPFEGTLIVHNLDQPNLDVPLKCSAVLIDHE